jgi:anti-sigma regulatory factor (Ser/Thr protein kinase)
MEQITVRAAHDQVRIVTDFVNRHLVKLGCSEHTRVQVDVAIDEIFSNIARYAYRPGTGGAATVRVEVGENPLSVIITFIDRGVAFDPLAHEQPDTTKLPAHKRPVGGLGLFMVKKTMDNISYEYRDGQNILTIRKEI